MKLIAFTDKTNKDLDNLTQIYLPCPRSNRRAVYFFNANNQLFETQKVTGPGRKSCWVIHDAAFKVDGAVRFISAIDGLFLCLPILENAGRDHKYRTLDDIFTRKNVHVEGPDGEMDIHRLSMLVPVAQLDHLCDRQNVGIDVYRLNEDRALSWLEKKIERLLLNAHFQQHFDPTEQDQQRIKLEAAYTLASYLPHSWFKKLLKKLGIEEMDGTKESLGEDVKATVDTLAVKASMSLINYDEFKNHNPNEIASPKRKDDIKSMDVEQPTKKTKPASKFKTTKGQKKINTFFLAK
ncbi:ribonuclease H2, subunit B [Sporodiniella umbellata]|nr:ribonuclease H2, subunit B [Sporodiniella umbellata]